MISIEKRGVAIPAFSIFFVTAAVSIWHYIKKMDQEISSACILTEFLLRELFLPKRASLSALRVEKSLDHFILTKKRNGQLFVCFKDQFLKKLEQEYLHYSKN